MSYATRRVMPQVNVTIPASSERKLRAMASEYEITFSDIISEALEWVLDSEAEFRDDLEAELAEEEEEGHDLEEEEEEDPESED